jgi:hypothetical protein
VPLPNFNLTGAIGLFASARCSSVVQQWHVGC